jgi:hypothetical protein
MMPRRILIATAAGIILAASALAFAQTRTTTALKTGYALVNGLKHVFSSRALVRGHAVPRRPLAGCQVRQANTACQPRGSSFDVRIKGDMTMRFMMIVKASKDSEAGTCQRDEQLLSAMGKYNEELTKAGVLLDGGGLQPSSKGARVKFSGGKHTVIDGPFAETKELIAGYWIIQVKSREEAIEWAKRVPAPHVEGQEGEIEIRQFFELDDFGPSEAVDRVRELGKELEKKRQA